MDDVKLEGELASGYRLIKPIMLTVETDDDGSIIVSDDVFYEYGVGASVEEAIADYKLSLVERYNLTVEHAEHYPNNYNITLAVNMNKYIDFAPDLPPGARSSLDIINEDRGE